MAAVRDDRGSTLPLLIGFFVVAATLVAAAVALGEVFVQQRGLQNVCDGAALAAAATAVHVGRGETEKTSLVFGSVGPAIDDYLHQDHGRSSVHVVAVLRDHGQLLVLTCAETNPLTFGRLLGLGTGVRHVVHSAARAPVR